MLRRLSPRSPSRIEDTLSIFDWSPRLTGLSQFLAGMKGRRSTLWYRGGENGMSLSSALRERPLRSLTLEVMVLSRYPSFFRCHAYWSIFSRSGTITDGVTRLVRGVGFEPTKAYAT